MPSGGAARRPSLPASQAQRNPHLDLTSHPHPHSHLSYFSILFLRALVAPRLPGNGAGSSARQMPSAPAPAANLPLARALFQSRRVYVFRTAPRASAARRLPWARPAVPPRLRATASVRASMQRRARIAARPWTTRACVAVHVAPATLRRSRARWACVRTSWIDRDAPNGGSSCPAAGLYQPVPVLPLDKLSISGRAAGGAGG